MPRASGRLFVCLLVLSARSFLVGKRLFDECPDWRLHQTECERYITACVNVPLVVGELDVEARASHIGGAAVFRPRDAFDPLAKSFLGRVNGTLEVRLSLGQGLPVFDRDIQFCHFDHESSYKLAKRWGIKYVDSTLANRPCLVGVGCCSSQSCLHLTRKAIPRTESEDSVHFQWGLEARIASVVMAGLLASGPITIADDAKVAPKSTIDAKTADVKAAPKPGIDAKTAFVRIKTLAGTWKSDGVMQPEPDHQKNSRNDHEKVQGAGKRENASIEFRLTGAGSAVIETQYPGTAHEMVSVYHLDGDDLRMTHYCAAGNQPRVKLDRERSTPTELIFVFDGGTNFDPQKDLHIHDVKISFHEDGKVTSAWESYAAGKSAGTMVFSMTRQKDSKPMHPARAKSIY